jgi:hypothetical protein
MCREFSVAIGQISRRRDRDRERVMGRSGGTFFQFKIILHRQ